MSLRSCEEIGRALRKQGATSTSPFIASAFGIILAIEPMTQEQVAEVKARLAEAVARRAGGRPLVLTEDALLRKGDGA